MIRYVFKYNLIRKKILNICKNIIFIKKKFIIIILIIRTSYLYGEELNQQNNNKESERHFLEVSLEVSNDLIFRGESFNGDLANLRNNRSYRSYTDAWSFQPYIQLLTPLEGFNVFIWGNVNLQHQGDRDSDFFLFQDGPGKPNRTQEVLESLSQGNLIIDPNKTKRHRERNGSQRWSGAFFGGDYNWQTKMGGFGFGTWMYGTTDTQERFTWQEWFLRYRPPILKFLNLEFGFYLNTSSSSQGIPGAPPNFVNGQKYISLDLNHTFRENEFFRIQYLFHTGYLSGNNNINKLSGFSNITNTIRLLFGNFSISGIWAYRPNPSLFDIGDTNPLDGRTPDPSKLYGWWNEWKLKEILNVYPNPEISTLIIEKFTSQKIPRHLYSIVLGYDMRF